MADSELKLNHPPIVEAVLDLDCDIPPGRLRALESECSVANWDGYDACPLAHVSAQLTKQFIRALPDGFPLPELAVEPDGAMSLDWIRSRNRVFSLSIGSNRRFAFAWLDGTDRGHGVAFFDGQSAPRRILVGIREVMSDGYAGFQ